jgi:uncharacterized protein
VKTIVVTGGTGFLGRRVVEKLLARGDRVVVLTRGAGRIHLPASGLASSATWTPDRAGPWFSVIDGADALIHLAGEPVIGKRWTDEQKARIRDSRVISTRLLVEAMEKAKARPQTFVCASAIGFYGDRDPGEALGEGAEAGRGFLAEVVRAWEAAAAEAEPLGVRTALLRIGIVLGEDGGALAQMLLPFKLFVGGPVGSGKQVLSWIHADDAVGLVLFALDNPEASGAINVTAPEPVDMNSFSHALGRAMGRPSLLRVPAFALKVAMGKAAEAVLTGQRVLPTRAQELGYGFKFPSLGGALADVLTARS